MPPYDQEGCSQDNLAQSRDDKTTIAKFILRLEEGVVYREIDQDEKESNGYTLLKKEWN